MYNSGMCEHELKNHLRKALKKMQMQILQME